MTTCESQDYLWRVESLIEVSAAAYGVSAEPLLSSLVLPESYMQRRNIWVIGGGESGRGARPTNPEWFRQLRDQCIAYDVPFHFKQWGVYDQDGRKRRGKKYEGYRTLDGRIWDQWRNR
jgi:protein gp37